MSGSSFETKWGQSAMDYRDDLREQRVWEQAYASGDAVSYRNDGYYSEVTTPYGTSLNWSENWVIEDKERPDLGYVGNEIRKRAGSDFAKDLFERYWLGRGDAVMSKERFLDIWNDIYQSDPKSFTSKGKKIEMSDGSIVFAKVVNFYRSQEYATAFGRATVFFDVANLPIGFYDEYDFDPKDFGIRSYENELKTRAVNEAGKLYGVSSFRIYYGIVPPEYYK
ncbi:hypothetical protein LVD15_03915 [Fulvivirga maritima]|uniref:hypothetical protein n=1 Tax=Fulvivirga maritima TaxID=2904247 RepID=UPI001F1718E0|nr:hypothetical protein [Fulvivirga maritima]UII27582.1 hypothetical protein LVD15_03915 [Fulvivirga maritima]